MSTRKRNEFLDIESEDDGGSDAGYDSEAAQESKGRASRRKQTVTARPAKRQKVSSGEESGGNDDDDDDDEKSISSKFSDAREEIELDLEEEEKGLEPAQDEEETDNGATATTSTPKPTRPTRPARPATKERKKNKTGVIYLSSLPPYLKPSALKSLLVARGFGPISKVFLSPYVPGTGASRNPSRSRNKRRMYTDGWVEFESKRTAKICAETLNASIVGGKKSGWYHDDMWNMKYLRGFKWEDLMEQVQREKREAEARRRIEDSKAKKEEKMFLSGLEKGKALEGMKRKREQKASAAAAVSGNDTAGGGGSGGSGGLGKARMVFRQNEVKGNDTKGPKTKEKKVDADVKRVLAKIF